MDSNASVSATSLPSVQTLDPKQTTLIPNSDDSIRSHSTKDLFPQKVAYFDFSMQGKLLLIGEKRLDLLQGITTNDLSKLLPGQSTRAFMLNRLGKIQTPLRILEFKKHTVLLLPFLQTEKIQERLQKDATLMECKITNITFDFALLNVAGNKAHKALEKTFGHIEPNAFTLHSLHSIVFQHKGGVDKAKEQATLGNFQSDKQTPLPGFAKINAGVDFAIIKQTRLQQIQNYDLLIPKDGLEKVMTKLKQNEITKQDHSVFNLQRIKDALPEWQTDYSEQNNPLELGSFGESFLSESKGCYLGQEIIARIKHRADAKTARKLVTLSMDGLSKGQAHKMQSILQLEPISLFFQEQDSTKKVGHLTSMTYSSETNKVYAFAFLQKPYYDTLTDTDSFVLVGQDEKEKHRAKVQSI